MSLSDLTIRRKILLSIVVTCVTVLVCVVIVYAAAEIARLNTYMRSDLLTLGRIMAGNCTAALAFRDSQEAGELLASLSNKPSIYSAQLFTDDGTRLAEYVHEEACEHLAQISGEPDGMPRFEDGRLVLHYPIRAGSQLVGSLLLESGLEERNQRLAWIWVMGIVSLAIAALVALPLAAGLGGLVSRPIVELTETAHRIAKMRDSHARAQIRSGDEVGALAASFNKMLDELEARDREIREAHAGLEKTVEDRTAELERSNKELRDFAYVVSHDLQEPLRKITAFGERLETKCGDGLTEQGKDYLARMVDAAVRMRDLIDDILALSRVTTRAEPFAKVDLGMTVRNVLSDLEISLKEGKGTVEVGDLPVIEAEPVQMRQLMQNLIGNALKFREEGVPPTVKVSAEIRAPAGDDNGECCLVVADNGIGFDEKYAERIFGVFQRLHARHEYSGTGIGLAICQKIVQRHGGSIEAHSTPGEGTRFVVTLPMKQPKQKDRQP